MSELGLTYITSGWYVVRLKPNSPGIQRPIEGWLAGPFPAEGLALKELARQRLREEMCGVTDLMRGLPR